MPVCANVHGNFLAEFYMYLLCLCFFQDETSFEQTKPECGAQLNSSSIVQILRQFDRFSLQRRLYYKVYITQQSKSLHRLPFYSIVIT